jgi:hypothetical protein
MKAIIGTDYVRDIDGLPVERNQQGWVTWANREAARKSKYDRVRWHAVCAYIIWRGCMRISFAAQPVHLLTGSPA